MEVAAQHGLGQLLVTAGTLDEMVNKVRTYNTLLHEGGHEPNQPTILLWLYCSEDPEDIAAGDAFFDQYSVEVAMHYGLTDPSNFEGINGYEAYLKLAKQAAAAGETFRSVQGAAGSSAVTQPIGTPEQIISRMRRLQEATSCKEIILVPQYSGMPFEKAEASVRLFAEKVLPVLQADSAPIHEASLPVTI